MTTTIQAVPNIKMAIYAAGALIAATHPRSTEELFAEIDFGPAGGRREKLQHAFDIGWLTRLPGGAIDVTEFSLKHFEDQAQKKYIGQITPAQYRPSVFRSQGLSKRHIPNRHGLRPASDAAPAWSVRETVSIKTISGGEA